MRVLNVGAGEPAARGTGELSKFWRAVFTVEIFVCLGTVGFWAAAPQPFLRDLYDLESEGAYHLLMQSANVVFCAYVYFYARILFSKPFDVRAFRWLQEAMAIGDVIIVATTPLLVRDLHPPASLVAAQAGMAALWLAIRLGYLIAYRPGTPSSKAPS